MSSNPSYSHEPSLGHSFTVAVLEADLRLHGCRSLKEKRGRLARIAGAVEKKHPVVVREVGDQDIWGRAGLAAVTLSGDANLAVRILEAVAGDLTIMDGAELVAHDIYECV